MRLRRPLPRRRRNLHRRPPHPYQVLQPRHPRRLPPGGGRDRLLESLPEELRPAYAPLLREEDPDIHALVKAADKLCAYLKCLEELQSGNQEFADAARQTLASLRDMNMPEIDWFLERFAPAFGLTLDGLQGR